LREAGRFAALQRGGFSPGDRASGDESPLTPDDLTSPGDAEGTRLGSGLKLLRERIFSARLSPASSPLGQRVFHARGRWPRTSRYRVYETRQRAPNLSPHQWRLM